eukprot:jgi/Bigna1/136578/aug1.34_g11286
MSADDCYSAGPLIYKFVTSVTSHPLDGGFPACPNVSVTIRCKEHDDGKLYGKILSGKSATTVDPADGEEEEKGPWFPISATERYFLVVCSSLPYRPDLEAEAGAKFDKKYEELFMEHLVSMKAKITKRIHALDSDARLSADSKSVVLTKKQQENHDLIEVMDDLMLTNELMALESKLAAFNSEYAQALSMEVVPLFSRIFKKKIKKPGLLREYSARGTVSVIVHDAVSLNIRRVHFDGHPALVRLVMSAAQSFQHTMLKRQGLRFGIWYTEAWEMFNRFDFFGEKFWRILCEQSMWILLSQPFHMARIAHSPDIRDNPSSFEILRRICARAQQNGQSLVFTNRVLNSLSYIWPLFWGFPTNLMIMGFGTFMDLWDGGRRQNLIRKGWSFASLAGLTIIPIEYTVIYLWPKLLLSYNRLPPRHRQKIRFFATFATTTTVGMLGVIALGENMFGENRKLRN